MCTSLRACGRWSAFDESGILAKQLTIAVDVMGGDGEVETVLLATRRVITGDPGVRALLCGDRTLIDPFLEAHPEFAAKVDVLHTDQQVLAHDLPAQAVRRARNSSMGLAIKAVKSGDAQVAVSAGNTGALMALSKVILRTMPGIERPALGALLPTKGSDSVMLDLGANVECDEDNLVQFALMGAAYARVVLGTDRPRVALLNIGEEDMKGNEAVKNAGNILRGAPLPLEFVGFTEGDRIFDGDLDVIVSGGFPGNVAIKTAEGMAKLISELLGDAFRTNMLSRIGYLFARSGLKRLRKHMDPNNHNGGVFLGLNGLVVKSHGGANEEGLATAIRVAVEMARKELSKLIAEDLKNFESDSIKPEELAEVG